MSRGLGHTYLITQYWSCGGYQVPFVMLHDNHPIFRKQTFVFFRLLYNLSWPMKPIKQWSIFHRPVMKEAVSRCILMATLFHLSCTKFFLINTTDKKSSKHRSLSLQKAASSSKVDKRQDYVDFGNFEKLYKRTTFRKFRFLAGSCNRLQGGVKPEEIQVIIIILIIIIIIIIVLINHHYLYHRHPSSSLSSSS